MEYSSYANKIIKGDVNPEPRPQISTELKKDMNHPRILFYSQLMMFSLNDSRGMSIFLKKCYTINYFISHFNIIILYY